MLTNLFASSDIATGGPEALGEGSHEDVDILRVESVVIDNTSAFGTHGANLKPAKEVKSWIRLSHCHCIRWKPFDKVLCLINLAEGSNVIELLCSLVLAETLRGPLPKDRRKHSILPAVGGHRFDTDHSRLKGSIPIRNHASSTKLCLRKQSFESFKKYVAQYNLSTQTQRLACFANALERLR